MAKDGSTQVVYRRTVGLSVQFSPIEKPAEMLGLAVAENTVLDREGLIESRRGFERYGDVLTTGASVISEFQGTLILVDGNLVRKDSDGAGTWSSYSGTYDPPDSDVKIRFEADQSSLFFTTSRGIKKLDSLTGTIRQAGMDFGLDLIPTLTGTGDSWFTPDGSVGYKPAFVRIDENEKETRGASGPRHILTNAITALLAWTRVTTTATVTHVAHGFTTGDIVEISASSDITAITNGAKTITVTGVDTYTFTCLNAGAANGTLSDGKAFDVSLSITIPDNVIAGDYVEVYRTEQSATAAIPVGDRYFRVIRQQLVAADITAGTVTILDTFDESWLGIDLYENDTQETIAQANYPPPWAKDVELFKGLMHYAYTRQPEFLQVRILPGIENLVDGTSSITVTSGATTLTYVFNATEDVATKKFKRFTGEPTLAQNIEKTARSFAKIVNRDTGNSLVYARYISGEEDEPGIILLTKRTANTTLFTLTANDSTTSVAFEPLIPTSGTTLKSDRENAPNRLYEAKPDQPDSVPLTSWDSIGTEFVPIRRIIATKDSLFILKAVGIWRKHGDTPQDMVIDPLAPDVQIVAPDAAVALDNAVWCLSAEGVLKIGDLGVEIVSRPIEVELLKILGFTDTETLAFAIAYHSERKYILSVPETDTDTTTDRQYVFNHLTTSWVEWLKSIKAGHVLTEDDHLYLSHAADKFILRERKTFSTTLDDYQDETIACTVTAFGTTTDADGATVSTATVTFVYATIPDRGFLFEQGGAEAKVISVVQSGGTFTLTLDREIVIAVGAATLTLPIPVFIRWNPEIAGSVASQKFYSKVQVYPERDSAYSVRLGFATNIVPAIEYTDYIGVGRRVGWGIDEYGTSSWGSPSVAAASTPIKTDVPTQHKRASGLSLIYRHSVAKERASVAQIAFTLRQVSDRTVRTPL